MVWQISKQSVFGTYMKLAEPDKYFDGMKAGE
jgi:hypothetical protein